ncbi:MAG: WG repeat-containing protein, partial [Ignavibacteria bacterium]|nr:WG repeat-containing protein [Ignavibacteria bacterium]
MKRILLIGLVALLNIASAGNVSDSNPLFRIEADGKYGYIDTTGKIIIKPQFDNARDFYEGLAVVGIGQKWGYIDKTGMIVIESEYDYVYNFSEGLAIVELGEKYGAIDLTGKT